MKDYCTQNNGDCAMCSLVNYGRDCQNNLLPRVLTAAEAAIVWGLDRSTVKKACQQGRFTTEECRKSGKNWLVTTDGMERVYGRREQL